MKLKLLNEDNLENKIKLLYLFDERWLILVELNKVFFTFNRSEWQVVMLLQGIFYAFTAVLPTLPTYDSLNRGRLSYLTSLRTVM